MTKEPTKKETGEKVLTCQNCGETETEVVPVVASTGAPVWLWIVIGVGVAAILLWVILAKRKKEDKAGSVFHPKQDLTSYSRAF